MFRVSVPVKRMAHGAGMALPSYAHEGDAGMDLRAAVEEPVIIAPGENALIPCGFSMAIPMGFQAEIRSRSGLAFKNKVVSANSPGTIDAGYRDEIRVILRNEGDTPFVVERGNRIAQMVFMPVVTGEWTEVEELDDTVRGKGGFGSTGVR